MGSCCRGMGSCRPTTAHSFQKYGQLLPRYGQVWAVVGRQLPITGSMGSCGDSAKSLALRTRRICISRLRAPLAASGAHCAAPDVHEMLVSASGPRTPPFNFGFSFCVSWRDINHGLCWKPLPLIDFHPNNKNLYLVNQSFILELNSTQRKPMVRNA